MALSPRAASEGFAERTRKNLLYVDEAFQAGADVHVITQLVNSLLGLVVFPWEKSVVERFRHIPLATLKEKGWPEWQLTTGQCSTLGQLIRCLRNGTSHGHIQFSSDSRLLNEVTIEVSNYPKWCAPDPDFEGSIRADELRDFCLKLTELVYNMVS
ncbi:MAG TPA: HEPN family nuclease [Longimicrobium sp.]